MSSESFDEVNNPEGLVPPMGAGSWAADNLRAAYARVVYEVNEWNGLYCWKSGINKAKLNEVISGHDLHSAWYATANFSDNAVRSIKENTLEQITNSRSNFWTVMRSKRIVYGEEIPSLSDEVEVEWKEEGGVGWLSDIVAEHFGIAKNNETPLKARVLNHDHWIGRLADNFIFLHDDDNHDWYG